MDFFFKFGKLPVIFNFWWIKFFLSLSVPIRICLTTYTAVVMPILTMSHLTTIAIDGHRRKLVRSFKHHILLAYDLRYYPNTNLLLQKNVLEFNLENTQTTNGLSHDTPHVMYMCYSTALLICKIGSRYHRSGKNQWQKHGQIM